MRNEGYGFYVDFEAGFECRESKEILHSLFYNLSAVIKGTREIKFRKATLTIIKVQGLGWLSLPLLPFALLHESLHLVIANFTPRERLVRKIPPFLDLLYLPLAIYFLLMNNPSIFFFFSVVGGALFMANLEGDFRPSSPDIEAETENPDTS